MASNSKELRVRFFQASVLDHASRRDLSAVDWPKALQPVADSPLADRVHDDIVYDVHTAEGEVPLVGVHKVLNTDFMTSINYRDRTITDLMEDAEADESARRFAHTTAMAFLPVGNVVAIASTSTSSPRPPKVLTEFLSLHMPQPTGVHWAAQPLMQPDKVEMLRKAKGAQKFTGQFDTARSIFDSDDEEFGIASFADEIAEKLGGDIIVDVTVRLAPEARNSSVQAKLRSLVLKDLPRLGRTKSEVKIISGDDVAQDVSLVASQFAASMPVSVKSSERLRYSALLEGLKDVSVDMQDEVAKLLRG